MILRAVCVALLISLAGCNVSFSDGKDHNLPPSTPGTKTEQSEAEAAARSFLSLIDQKQYEKTWELAGPALRSQTSEFTWVNTLKLTRGALSVGSNRQLEGFGFSTKIDPSVPVGEYVLVQFKEIDGSTTTTEKVVMQKHQSKWLIVGYFVHKQSKFGGGT